MMNKEYNERVDGQIVFVSEMRSPYKNASSTQIMTKNLLYGFNNLTTNLLFVAIVEDNNDRSDIHEYYKELCKNIVFVNDVTKYRTYPIRSKLSMLLKTIVPSKKCEYRELLDIIDNNAILVSHSPSIDSALICEQIKKNKPSTKYVQYWGDPLTLSLITPNEYSVRRYLQKFVEKKLHRTPDKIVFGTRSLYEAQLSIFPEIRNKTSSVEVCYNPEDIDSKESKRGKPLVGYFGNYYSNIRNIVPFYEAALEVPEAEFVICGSGDVELKSDNNVRVYGRITQSEVASKEAGLDVVVCLLNRVGVQIPGKVFYQTNTHKPILVVSDGPYKEGIVSELKASGRFVFCDNDKDSIRDALERILCDIDNNTDWDVTVYSPEEICKGIIYG